MTQPARKLEPEFDSLDVHAAGKVPLARLTQRLLWPLARLWLQSGFTVYEINEILRWVFAKVALTDQQFALGSRKAYQQSQSRAAILSGLPRREIQRLAAQDEPDLGEVTARYHRAARVLAAWQQDPEFHDANGKPRPLKIRDADEISFSDLVYKYCRDVPARAMADELLAQGNLERDSEKRLHLRDPVYACSSHSEADLAAPGGMAEAFLHTLEKSLDSRAGEKPQLRDACVANVSAERLPMLNAELAALMDEYASKCEALIRKHAAKDEFSEDTLAVGVSAFNYWRAGP